MFIKIYRVALLWAGGPAWCLGGGGSRYKRAVPYKDTRRHLVCDSQLFLFNSHTQLSAKVMVTGGHVPSATLLP